MEASQLALLADGTGWTVLANAAQGMELTLLNWRRLDVDHFAISEKELISESWDPDRPGCLVCDEPAMPLDDRTRFRYELVTQVPPLAESPMRALKVDALFHFAQS